LGILGLAWNRFNTIANVIGDVQGRVITMIFYFTILMPFGLISSLFNDPLALKSRPLRWQDREPVPNDIDSAREQG
jgi:hypothetical protein